MDLYAQVAFLKTHRPGSSIIKDLVDNINFNKMVSRSQGTDLGPAAFLGPGADHAGIGAGQLATFFSSTEISLRCISLAQGPF